MAKLPILHTDDQNVHLLQTRWAAIINPLLVRPYLQGLVLENVELKTGVNAVNHTLGRKLQGWNIVRQRAAASLHDLQDLNSKPELTLILQSSADVKVDIYVF